MKQSPSILLSLLLLTCWQQMATATAPPPTPPAVGPQSAPEPLLLSPEFEEEYADPTEDNTFSPEEYTATRFQARFITLKDQGEEEPQPEIFSVSGFGIQYGWTRHQWVRNLDNETHIDEVYKREIVVGVPLLLIALSTLLSVALLIIEIYDRFIFYNNTTSAEEYYSNEYYSALDGC